MKYETPVTFTNHATMFFACNDLPVLKDDTRGNWRRWVLIRFTQSFSEGDDDHIPRRQLDKELTAESELQGLLTRCVEEIKAWDKGRVWFPDVDSWKTTRRKMRKAAEPVFGFAETCLRPSEDGFETKENVRTAYKQYAAEEGVSKMGAEKFGQKLLNLPDLDVETGKNRISGGDPQRIYQGIEFTSRGRQLLDKARGELSEYESLGGGSPRWEVVNILREASDPLSKEKIEALTELDDLDEVIQHLKKKGEITYVPTEGDEDRYVLTS